MRKDWGGRLGGLLVAFCGALLGVLNASTSRSSPGPATGFGWAAAKLFELAATRAAQHRHSISSATLLEAFHTIDSDLTNSKVTAGPEGSAVWTPPAPGRYSVYVKDVTYGDVGIRGGTSEAERQRLRQVRQKAHVEAA